jgi:hypothetical protein
MSVASGQCAAGKAPRGVDLGLRFIRQLLDQPYRRGFIAENGADPPAANRSGCLAPFARIVIGPVDTAGGDERRNPVWLRCGQFVSDPGTVGIPPEREAVEGELVGEREDVTGIVGNGVTVGVAGRIALPVATVVKNDYLKACEPGDVTGISPHPRIATSTRVKHDGEAIADNVVREVQAGVHKRSHLPSVALGIGRRKRGRRLGALWARPVWPRPGNARGLFGDVWGDGRGGGRPATGR